MEMVLQPRGAAAAAAGASSPRKTTTMRQKEEEEVGELRRGPWTVDEDLTLINYIAEHGEGRWNALARAAGLKRTGKSCRLRWLNYLRPDVKRGDFTADEQLLILDLHSRWGNRWSKIAAQLPGRTDNEIKNYWRTRVQKHARQLGCHVDSRRFKDAMAYLWMPRLAERAAASHSAQAQQQQQAAASASVAAAAGDNYDDAANKASPCIDLPALASGSCFAGENNHCYLNSPGGGGGGVLAGPSSSSSDSSLTSTDSCAAHEEKSVYNNNQLHPGNAATTGTGAGDHCWAAMQGADHEFWSAAAPALQQLGDAPQDLTGWVQGFCDADQHSLWSLDDIWRMH